MSSSIDQKQDPSVTGGFLTYTLAATVVFMSLGSANLVENTVWNRKRSVFAKETEIDRSSVISQLDHSFAPNEIKEIEVYKLGDKMSQDELMKYGDQRDSYINILINYNEDGSFDESESVIFETVKSLAKSLVSLFSNESVAYVNISVKFLFEETLRDGIKIEAARIKFAGKLVSLESKALMNPYANFFDLAESYYIDPALKNKRDVIN